MREGMPNAFMQAPDVIVKPGDGEDNGYGGNPSDEPSSGGSYTDIDTSELDLPFSGRRSGAAELIALETLYQTLMFYGVIHVVERQGNKKSFKIVQSRSGYFINLTALDVAFAIRAFSQYIVALLCNEPTQENFSKLLSQFKPEEIGLRFKYDMAWALLGNYLPKDANDIFKMGTKWKTITQIFATTQSIRSMDPASASHFRTWVAGLGDVMNMVVRLNRIMCFVDVRPDPREEIKKRILVKNLLTIDKGLGDRYGEMKELLDEIFAASRAVMASELQK